MASNSDVLRLVAGKLARAVKEIPGRLAETGPSFGNDREKVCLLRFHGRAMETPGPPFEILGVDAQTQVQLGEPVWATLGPDGCGEVLIPLPGADRPFDLWIHEPTGDRVAPHFGPMHGGFASVLQIPVYPLPSRVPEAPTVVDFDAAGGVGVGAALDGLAENAGWSSEERLGVFVLAQNAGRARLQPRLNSTVAAIFATWADWLLDYGIRVAVKRENSALDELLRESNAEENTEAWRFRSMNQGGGSS